MNREQEQHRECGNWLNYDAIRETVAEYQARWGATDDEPVVLDEITMTQNCMTCNLKPKLPPTLSALVQVVELFKDPILVKLEKVGMIRTCFQETKNDTK